MNPSFIVMSNNPLKKQALEEALAKMQHKFPSYTVDQKTMDYNPPQPKSQAEIVLYAKNRASMGKTFGSFGVGLESGIYTFDKATYDVCCCAIFDGKKYVTAWGPSLPLPQPIVDYIYEHDVELDLAAFKTGFTEKEGTKFEAGLVGRLTHDAYTRKESFVLAVGYALSALADQKQLSLDFLQE